MSSSNVFVTSTDDKLGTPNFLWAPRSNAVRRRTTTPERAARTHLETLASRYRLSREALDAATVTQVSDAGKNGVIVVMRQKIGGIEVIERDAKILMDESLSLIAIGGGLHPSAFANSKLGHFVLEGDAAAARAFDALYPSKSGVRLLRPARVKKVYFPAGAQLVPAYAIEVAAHVTGVAGVAGEDDEAHSVIVGATDGRILRRTNLVRNAAFNYRVFADASGRYTPMDGPIANLTPHPTGKPDGTATSFVAPNLVTIDGFSSKADPWLAAGATETRGNNVDAYTDDATDGFSAGDLRASITSPGTFDRTYDLSAEPTATNDQKMAAVTNAFFVTNWLHDDWYDAGFDEAAGNAQTSNYGRGGSEGDTLRVEVQDSFAAGKRNNANAMTPSDGESPRLQFYVWDADGVSRDSALDTGIVAHEWGHYLHQRLVDCSSDQCGAESEGWGDFVALHLSLRPGDDLGGTFAMAQYSSAAFSNDTSYFGLRRFPYSVDFTKNALTFKHITTGTPLPDVPKNDDGGYPNAEVHNAGEVWASMLWEGYVALQKRASAPASAYTFDEARRRMASYVVGGMKLAPANPTFTEQRDAILASAFARDAADATALAGAFARRGAGTCAESPARDSSDFDGVVESFEVKAAVAIASVVIDDSVQSCDSDGYIDAGETGRAVVRITNRGFAALAGAQLKVSSSLAGVTFPKGATVTVPSVAPLASLDLPVEVALPASVTGAQLLGLSFELSTPGACSESVLATATKRANVDERAASSATDDVEASTTTWTAKDLDGHTLGQTIWKRVETAPGAHAWHADDYTSPSDSVLESPVFAVVSAGSFAVSFSHRYQFESADGTHWDGAVVEVSSDDGANWVDASTLSTPHYGGVIGDPDGGAQNTLKGRQGYVAESAGWPERTTETLDFGTALAGKRVKIRFRVATDDATGASGWDIDDVRATGAVNSPFAAVTNDDGVCAAPPTASAGADQNVVSGTTVRLDGSASRAKGNGALTFNWLQTAGSAVALSDQTSAKTTFVAPRVAKAEKLSFQVSVRDGVASAVDSVDVMVTPNAGEGATDGEDDGTNGAVVSGGDANSDSGCSTTGGAGSKGLSALGTSALGIALAALVGRRRKAPSRH